MLDASRTTLRGFISRKDDRGFGFVQTHGGDAYFFHLRDLPKDVRFETLPLNQLVDFVPVDQTPARGLKPRLRDRATQIQIVA